MSIQYDVIMRATVSARFPGTFQRGNGALVTFATSWSMSSTDIHSPDRMYFSPVLPFSAYEDVALSHISNVHKVVAALNSHRDFA